MMKSVKILIAIVVVLVLVNCGMLAFFWLHKPHGRPEKPEPPQRAHEFLAKALALTKDQDGAYTKMREDHFATTRKLNEANKELHDSLFAYIKSPTLDSAKVKALEQKIANNQVKLENTTLLHFRELRSILTTAQQKKFDEVIQDALRMMGGSPRGGKPGPGGMPPPRERDTTVKRPSHDGLQGTDGMKPHSAPPLSQGEGSNRPHRPERGDGRGLPPPPPDGRMGPPPGDVFGPPPGGQRPPHGEGPPPPPGEGFPPPPPGNRQ